MKKVEEKKFNNRFEANIYFRKLCEDKNIWKEDLEKTPLLSVYKFNKYMEDGYYVDYDLIDDVDYSAKIELLTRYENNKIKAITILESEFELKHSKGGRKPKLTIEDKLNATVEYSSSTTTFKELAKKYSIHESNMYDNIMWVLNTLSKHKIIGFNYNDIDGRLFVYVNCKKLYFYKIKKDVN